MLRKGGGSGFEKEGAVKPAVKWQVFLARVSEVVFPCDLGFGGDFRVSANRERESYCVHTKQGSVVLGCALFENTGDEGQLRGSVLCGLLVDDIRGAGPPRVATG